MSSDVCQIDSCDGVLVIGTSLEVFSGYRFVERANTLGIPIAIVNAGMTRAERKGLPRIVLKVEGECASIMKQALHMLIDRS
jgi:NAD-dependent SIR2 family protein deacetylase